MSNWKTAFWINLVVSLVLIAVGAFLVGFVGFNADSTTCDANVIEVRDMLRLSDDARDALQDHCSDELASYCGVSSVKVSEASATGATVLEFSVGADSEEELAGAADSLRSSLESASIEGVDAALITVSYHLSENAPYYTYIWRTAIAVGVSMVLLFAYAAIRFKLSAGLSVLVAGAHDVLLTLALVAILRIPAGVGLVGVAVFSFLLSAFLSMTVFGKVRTLRSEEATRGMSAAEMVDVAVKDRRGIVAATAVFAALFCVILGVIGIFVGLDMTWIMLASLLAVAVSACSSLFLAPSMYATLKG